MTKIKDTKMRRILVRIDELRERRESWYHGKVMTRNEVIKRRVTARAFLLKAHRGGRFKGGIGLGESSSRVARGAAMAAAWLSLLVRWWVLSDAKVGLPLPCGAHAASLQRAGSQHRWERKAHIDWCQTKGYYSSHFPRVASRVTSLCCPTLNVTTGDTVIGQRHCERQSFRGESFEKEKDADVSIAVYFHARSAWIWNH